MERYIIHLDNVGFTPKDAKRLFTMFKELVINDITIRDVRVATRHIELDVSTTKDKLDYLLERLESIAPIKGYLEIKYKDMSKEESIAYARRLFNEERYWECHEALEPIWRKSEGKERDLLQGIILIAAAFVHAQRGEEDVAYSILKRALPKLTYDSYEGISISNLREYINNILNERKIILFQI